LAGSAIKLAVNSPKALALLGSLALPERLHDPLALFGKVLDLL
jgi:hypothetical protein